MRYRHLKRTVIAVPAAVAFLLVLGLVVQGVLESRAVRGRVVGWLEGSLAPAVGVDLEVGSLRWRLVPPRLVIGHARVVAAGVHAEVESLTVDLAHVWWLRRSVELGTVSADGVRIRFTGMPRIRRGAGRSPVRVAVRHLDLRRVDFEGLNLTRSLSLRVDGFDAGWTSDGEVQRGFFATDRIQVTTRGLEPFAVAAVGRFERRGGFEIPRFKVRGTGVELTGRGRVGNGRARIEAEGGIDMVELDRVVRAKGNLEGRCTVTAVLDTSAAELLQVVVRSASMRASEFPVERLRGRLGITRNGMRGVVEQAFIHGGMLHGTYTMEGLRRPRSHTVRAEMAGMELAAFLEDLKVPAAGMAARTDMTGELHWVDKDVRGGRGSGVAHLRPAGGLLPVTGRVDAELTPDGVLRFSGDGLRIGGSTVTWQGPLTLGRWEPGWSIRARPAVLAELIPMVNTWVGGTVLPEEIHGNGELQVDLSGPWKQLRVGLRLEAQPLLYPPMRIDRIVAEGTIEGSALDLGSVRFRVGDGGGDVDGRIAWKDVPEDEQLDLEWRGQGIPLAQVAAWLDLDQGFSGTAALAGGLRGPLASPRGSWALGLVDAGVFGQALGDGSATIDLDEGRFTLRGLSFDGGLSGGAWWDVITGEVGGDLAWPNAPLAGLGDTAAQMLGETASLDLNFRLPRAGALTGRGRAEARGAYLEIEAGEEQVTVEASLVDAASAAVTLERGTDGDLAGGGTLLLLAAEEVAARLQPGSGVPLTGHGGAVLDVSWPAGGLPRIDGLVEELDLELDSRPISLIEPAPFTLSPEGLVVDGLYVSLVEDEAFLRWAVDADGSLRGNVSGAFDTLLLRFLLPDWEPAGHATGVVELLGTVERPLLEGVAEVSQVSFRIPGSRSVVSRVDGTALLSSDEVVLEGMDFRFMQGRGRCSGRIGWKDGAVRLSLDGSMANLEYPLFPGLAPRVAATWRLDGPVGDLVLSGDVAVERAILRRRDDPGTILYEWFEEAPQAAAASGLGLDLRVTADRTIEARSPFLHLTGSAALDIGGSPEELGLVGTLEFQEGGDFTFQGVRYEIERAVATFTDPLRIDPLLDLEARAWVQNYQISVRLAGTFDRLVPTLSSDPPLSEAEIYSLLALGFRSDAMGGGAVGVGFASTILTRQINAELERRARTLLPVDQVRVDPFAWSSTGNPTARVTVVKQLNPRWTLILQSNISDNREEVVVSRWILGPGLFLEATRDIDGTYAMDLKVRRRY